MLAAEPGDAWSERPLDDGRVEVESDSELSSPSPTGGGDTAPADSPSGDHRPAQDDGKHSLLQYAMLHFRDAEEK